MGGTENALVPSQVLALKDSKVVHVACGSNHTLIVTEKNQLFVCGKGEKGELGLSSPPPSQPIILPTPIDLREASGNRIVSIACGSNFSAAVIGPDVYT